MVLSENNKKKEDRQHKACDGNKAQIQQEWKKIKMRGNWKKNSYCSSVAISEALLWHYIEPVSVFNISVCLWFHSHRDQTTCVWKCERKKDERWEKMRQREREAEGSDERYSCTCFHCRSAPSNKDQMNHLWHLQSATDITRCLVRRPLNQVASCQFHPCMSSAAMCSCKLFISLRECSEHMGIFQEQGSFDNTLESWHARKTRVLCLKPLKMWDTTAL